MIKCVLCGKEYKGYNYEFSKHLKIHNITTEEYYNNYINSNDGKCLVCNKKTTFISINKGYRKYCSMLCVNQSEKHKNHIAETKLERYNDPYYHNTKKAIETYRNTCKNRTEEDRRKVSNNISQAYNNMSEDKKKEIAKKISQSQKQYYSSLTDEEYNKLCQYRHDVAINRSKDSIKLAYIKSLETKLKNETFPKSPVEDDFYIKLLTLFKKDDIIRQYYEDRYPYACDFYIKSLDLFIEINNHWTHGKHPFDINKDLDVLNKLIQKQETNKNYSNYIYVWTKLDVEKYNTALKNNLRYMRLYNNTEINNAIKELQNEIKSKWN